MSKTVKFYILKNISENEPRIRLLGSSIVKTKGTLFKSVPKDFSLSSFSITESLNQADFCIVPQSIKELSTKTRFYLKSILDEVSETDKKIILFLKGDYSHRIHIADDRIIVFKGSEFKKKRFENEIIFAPFVEDLGAQQESISFLPKGDKPSIGFCGYAGFSTVKSRCKYFFENAFYDLSGKTEYKRGIFFRKKSMFF